MITFFSRRYSWLSFSIISHPYNDMAITIATKKQNNEGEKRWREAGSAIGSCLFRAWRWLRRRGPIALMHASAAFFLFYTCYAIFIRPDPNDPFALPFCDADGNCHENPDKPSPRTAYSAWNKKQYNLWLTYYETLKKRVSEYSKKRQGLYDSEDDHENSNRTRPLILLGDSITEAWLGTGLGITKSKFEGVPQVLEEELSSTSGLDPIVLGMSGDQTQHLLYRLENDHMRAAQLTMTNGKNQVVGYDPSAIFVIMIGTNNLGSGEVPGPTAKGVLAVVEYILKETAEAGCHVMLFQVLPRGDGYKILPNLCPPRCSDFETKTAFSSFLPAVDKVNKIVANETEVLNEQYSSRLQLVDCGSRFLNENYDYDHGVNMGSNYEVKKEVMPDLLHPNAAGHRILAKCIRDYIDQIDV